MKIIKVRNKGEESIYIFKRTSIFSRKRAIYWISQNMALPVVDVSDSQYEPEKDTQHDK